MLTLPKLLLCLFTADDRAEALWTKGLLHEPEQKAGQDGCSGSSMYISKGVARGSQREFVNSAPEPWVGLMD